VDDALAKCGDLDRTTVIVDPPRKGLDEALVRYLAQKKMKKIVYVSCDPDTLARDCALFRTLGYEIEKVTPVDMFPKTGHVESVVCLRGKSPCTK
jgi:23S rRNA (uracil1939-C5)-methyltransferase